MAYQQFATSDTNPNDTTGGGGCVCDPQRQIDCKPPYAVFFANDMDGLASPHVVICRSCATAVLKAMDGEILSAGEKMDNPLATGQRPDLPKPQLSLLDDEGEDEPPEV